MEITTAVYHSERWGMLVETGYVTMVVNDGIAFMIREARRARMVWY